MGVWEACRERQGWFVVRRCGYGCPWRWDMAVGGGLVWFVGVWEACRERQGWFVVRRCGYGCLWWWDMAVRGDWCGLWVWVRFVVSAGGCS
ncbi:hypothetical protein [Bartonella elizabethae]|uniref:hypothetical protein n=1 Tax=Bartonella elizabethae TaxID=807 RepID=UPI000F832B0C|nr:hypothetical protein [Bartonella elizabethae]